VRKGFCERRSSRRAQNQEGEEAQACVRGLQSVFSKHRKLEDVISCR
jgi:hypothetical protein